DGMSRLRRFSLTKGSSSSPESVPVETRLFFALFMFMIALAFRFRPLPKVFDWNVALCPSLGVLGEPESAVLLVFGLMLAPTHLTVKLAALDAPSLPDGSSTEVGPNL